MIFKVFMKKEEFCAECKFFKAIDDPVEGFEAIGLCRRNPPVYIGRLAHGLHEDHPDDVVLAMTCSFVAVDQDAWCGEFKPA